VSGDAERVRTERVGAGRYRVYRGRLRVSLLDRSGTLRRPVSLQKPRLLARPRAETLLLRGFGWSDGL
jgi:hypothetical protein